MSRNRKVKLLAAAASIIGLALVGYYQYAGWYGFNSILRRGASIWLTVKPDDARVSPAMRAAFRHQPPPVKPGPFAWTLRAPGFETGELAVITEEIDADRFLLARIDPAHFRIEVLNHAPGNRDLDDWMQLLGATLFVNGGYFAPDGTPDTPTVINGALLGPRSYEAKHGAFIVSDAFTGIRDLENQDWRKIFKDARFGFVSYPMLVRQDEIKVKANPQWLANRSFIGQDSSGHIIIGTSKDAFFSLDRLADFLRASPLGLTFALNLDGGPLACQGIKIGDYTRDFCGTWETQTKNDEIKLLRPLIGTRRRGLPNVIAVIPKEQVASGK